MQCWIITYDVEEQDFLIEAVLGSGISHRSLTAAARIDPRPVHVGFVVDKGALGDVILRVLRFSRHYDSTNAPY